MSNERRESLRIGLISDTHNLVRPEALHWLTGCDAIVHAGDVCAPHVLEALSRVAPVTAVRGNNDVGAWADALPEETTLAIGGIAIRVVHDIGDLSGDPRKERIDVVVTGHSHKPSIETRDGVLFVNPGSAGPRRFKLPVSAGMLVVERGRVHAEVHKLIG
ncbi:MAG TPA: metallophosphoesterase family protein [Trinickia sp.]|jgi:putative phosphoesterase|uniref:metallophosphoesterase family protein n=1 Tax=Trinickia sp. TaxID=2571163 RepID=UPI002CF24696|nr:metallophosphoesterase family protein [Trinickia sp.]HTI19320.1 metallophosphoesterase family protein [Trinickia sp.]